MGGDVFRPGTGRVVAALTMALCVVGLTAVTVQYGVATGLRWAPFLVLGATTSWALLWRPCVRVDPAGVTMVNVVRTITVPWPAIVEVETRWGLTLVTPYGRFTAWAAPAPGAAHALRHTASTQGRHLPRTTYREGTVRPGDLPSSQSGSAALIVRTWWERLHAQGLLDQPQLEFARPPSQWHVATLATGVVIVMACVLSLMV